MFAGPEMPGATKSETIFSSVYTNVVDIIEVKFIILG